MAIDRDTPEGQVFYGLNRQLHERRTGRCGGKQWNREASRIDVARPGLDLLWDYFTGNPPLNRVHEGWKDYIRGYIRMGRLNAARLLVTSTRNRMNLWGYMTAAAEDEAGDQAAENLLRATGRGFIRDTHDFMLALGDGYVICTPPETGRDAKRTYPVASAGDPRQVITADDPLTGRPKYGLNLFRDEWDSADFAYVYFPDGVIRRAIKQGTSTIRNTPFRLNDKSWSWDETYGVNGNYTTPDGLFPIIHFENEHGVGEFEEHLDHLDRINDKIFNEWWTSKIQAFRQRAVKNLPDKDDDGADIDYSNMFTASPDEMWQVPGDVEFWESTPVDLNPIVTSIQKDLERLAAVAQQPLHTITPDAANGSAEGASLMREEHLFKINDRIERVDPRHCDVMATLFAFAGDSERSDVTQIRTLWGPTERHALQAKADAASKVKGIMPNEWIWTEIMQVHPSELPRLRTLMGRQRLDDVVALRAATVVPGQVRATQVPAPTPPAALPAPAPPVEPAAS